MASGGSAGAGADEIEMIASKRPRLLGRKPERGLVRLERVDALEQRLVQIGVAVMAGEDRGDGALDRLQFVVRCGAGEVEENARDPVERTPAALERLDRIGEGRRRRVGGDGVDLRPRLPQRGSNAGPK